MLLVQFEVLVVGVQEFLLDPAPMLGETTVENLGPPEVCLVLD
jgi:hypothetical protein